MKRIIFSILAFGLSLNFASSSAFAAGNCWILGEGLSSSRAERAVRECWEGEAREAQQKAKERAKAVADYNEVAARAAQTQTDARVNALLAGYRWGGPFIYNGFDGKTYYYSSRNLACSLSMTSYGDSVTCLNRIDGSRAIAR